MWSIRARPADTTGGLNRNGSVMLLVPAEHEPLTLGGDRAYWLRARLLPSNPDRPPYTTSPQLQGVSAVSLGGTALAEHSVRVEREVLGTSDGKPGQELRLANRPVLTRTPEERLEVSTAAGTEDWVEVDNFMRSGPDDRHYVIDATTGQNGLAQARQFSEATDVTGVVLTKLDGSAKGGIVFAVETELGIPVKLVGVGEQVGDLIPFDPNEFVNALFDSGTDG